MSWSLQAAAGASLAAAALFAVVGLRLRGRQGPGGTALTPFIVWWLGMGAATACYAVRLMAGHWGADRLVAFLVAVGVALAGLAMWGLLDYLSYVYRGRPARGALWGYVVLVALTSAHIAWTMPRAVDVGDWTVQLAAQQDAAGIAIEAALTIGFLLPPIIAGVLFLRLLPRVGDDQRRRVLAVGLGVPGWALVHLIARISMSDPWQFVSRVLLGVAVAAGILIAYGAGPPRAAVSDAFQERVRTLV